MTIFYKRLNEDSRWSPQNKKKSFSIKGSVSIDSAFAFLMIAD
jgi:hypothetical protein